MNRELGIGQVSSIDCLLHHSWLTCRVLFTIWEFRPLVKKNCVMYDGCCKREPTIDLRFGCPSEILLKCQVIRK